MSDQEEFVKLKINTMGDRVACAGVHFGLGPRVRKLEPGEVVPVPKSLMIKKRNKQVPLYKALLETDKVVMTDEDVTRPFEYESVQYAEATSASFNANSDDKVELVEDAKESEAQAAAEFNKTGDETEGEKSEESAEEKSEESAPEPAAKEPTKSTRNRNRSRSRSAS